MTETEKPGVTQGYHAHVYFESETLEQAKDLCQRCQDKFQVEIGKYHERPVGPHPVWSCQLLFEKGKFGRVAQWLMKNRNGLRVFIHPITGDDYRDHTDHAIWLGDSIPLNLSFFKK